jgi:hypothetical protein
MGLLQSLAHTLADFLCASFGASVTQFREFTEIKKLLFQNQYLRRLNGVDSMVHPPKFSHFGHHLINKNGIGRFRKQF